VIAALRAAPRARAIAAGAVAAGALLAALTAGNGGAHAARAVLAVAALGAVAAVARARRRPAREPRLAVVSRAPLGRESGIAVVEVDGRRIVVGWASGGVRVLAETAAPEGARP
jgi:flagellar protein FliO/FliZ